MAMIRLIKVLLLFLFFFLIFWLIFAISISISAHFSSIPEKYTFGNTERSGFSFNRSVEFNDWICRTKKKKGIIIGTSTAFRNIIPDSLKSDEIEWFNLGSSLQTIDISKIILETIIKKHKIDFVLIDYYPPIHFFSNFESTLDLVKNSTFELELKLKLLQNSEFHLVLYNQLFYRLIKEKMNSPIHLKEDFFGGEYIRNGYVAMKSEKAIPIPKKTNSTRKLNENQTLQTIVEMLKREKIHTVINIAPSFYSDYELSTFFPNEQKIFIIEIFKLPNRDSIFYDSHHMTHTGSQHYSSLLNSKLEKLISE